MSLGWITATALLFSLLQSKAYMVKKCCPSGQLIMFGQEFFCDPLPAEMVEKMEYWFPFDDVYDSSRLDNLTQSEVDLLKNKLNLPGSVLMDLENCSTPGLLLNTSEDFRFLYDKDKNEVELVIMGGSAQAHEIMLDYGRKLSPHHYCVDSVLFYGEMYGVLYCPDRSKPWIRKCCSAAEVVNFFNETFVGCTSIPEHWNLSDWRPHKNKEKDVHRNFVYVPDRSSNFPVCENEGKAYFLKRPDKDKKCRGFQNNKMSFLIDGSVKIAGEIFAPHEYCADGTSHPNGTLYENNLIYCPKQDSSKNYVKVIYGTVFLLGGVCLLVTVAISLSLPELRNKIHNKIAITHNATLMVAHFIWGLSQFWTYDMLGTALCTLVCLMVQFFFLGSLFWLNAMCINMSSTFRTTQKVRSQSAKSEARRYLIYSLYAWGLTGLIAIFTVSMEFADEPLLGLPRPGFSCFCDFARHGASVLLYFYGPMIVILIFNLVLYVFTTWKIISVYRMTRNVLHHTDSKSTGTSSQTDYQRLVLYSKLFLLMGLTWMTEIISWAVDGQGFIWIVLDLINLLRAVFIFIIFICKKPILISLVDKFRSATGRPRTSGESNHSTATDAISMSTIGPNSRKVSQEVNRKKSKDEWSNNTENTRLFRPNEYLKSKSIDESNVFMDLETEGEG